MKSVPFFDRAGFQALEGGLSSSSSIESAAEEADLCAIRSSAQLLLLNSVAHLLANVWRSMSLSVVC